MHGENPKLIQLALVGLG